MFRHDMSAVVPTLPRSDGSFRSERLDAALDESESGWHPWLLTLGEQPGGFAIVRSVDQPVRVLNSFFVVAGARRHRLGFDFARAVVQAYPGAWDVPYQDYNPAAVGLWPTVAASVDASYTLERRGVPAKPELPADVWLSFRV
jgi:predicted acetyltransferase